MFQKGLLETLGLYSLGFHSYVDAMPKNHFLLVVNEKLRKKDL